MTEVIAADVYLTFRLEDEMLALEVAKVREVLDLCPITRVPRTSEYMRGVINLRGTVIPVIDLRLKFGLPKTKSTIDARIIVISFLLEGADTVVGLLTDSVHEVIDIAADQIDTSPRLGTRWRTEFIRGIGKSGDQFLLLLDIDRVLTARDLHKHSEIRSEISP